MEASIMRPGFLVSAKTALRGGVTYDRTDLDAGVDAQEGVDVKRWETIRTIVDPDEHERAVKVRGAVVATIRRVCSATSFGLLCPLDREAALDAAITEARGMAEAFNREARYAQIGVYVLKGRVAETDEEATRAIAEEVRGLLDDMERGVRDLNPKTIRDAANKARSVSAMLEKGEAEAVGNAIDAARTAARAIVKRIEKGGEDAATVLAELRLGAVQRARFAFLDMAEAGPVGEAAALPGVDVRRFGGLDVTVDAAEGC